jgi:hypothetical protein
MNKIKVTKVTTDRVTVQVTGIQFIFGLNKFGKVKVISKSKNAQIYDRNNCWVPKELFSQAYQQAAAILNKSQKKSQITLFDEVPP